MQIVKVQLIRSSRYGSIVFDYPNYNNAIAKEKLTTPMMSCCFMVLSQQKTQQTGSLDYLNRSKIQDLDKCVLSKILKAYGCNIVVTWSRHVILLIIISNNILLSPPITLTYHLIYEDSFFWYIKSHSFIIGNWFSYIALLKNTSATILFIGKCSFYYSTSILISIHQHPIC